MRQQIFTEQSSSLPHYLLSQVFLGQLDLIDGIDACYFGEALEDVRGGLARLRASVGAADTKQKMQDLFGEIVGLLEDLPDGLCEIDSGIVLGVEFTNGDMHFESSDEMLLKVVEDGLDFLVLI